MRRIYSSSFLLFCKVKGINNYSKKYEVFILNILKSLFKHYFNFLSTIVVKTTLVILFLNSEQFRRWNVFSRIIHNISEERRGISNTLEWYTFCSLQSDEGRTPKFEQRSLFKL